MSEGERKFLCVIDDTPECGKALRFAARRAQRTHGGVTMLYVVQPEATQFWAGVGERIREDAFRVAEERLLALSGEVRDIMGIMPEFIIAEGDPVDEILKKMRDLDDIVVLVLGAATGDRPGPLVSALTGSMAAKLPIPVTIVPGSMSLEQIDAIC